MIKKLPAILLLLIFTVGCLQERDVRLRSCAAADLLTYVEKPDSSYKWEKVSKTDAVFSSGFLLKMTSQTWQGITWTHDIEIFMPAKSEFPGTAFLMITFGKPGGGESQIGSLLAANAGCPVAILYGIPNQPLYDGKREDALIAYTFTKYLETGDASWPLLFPMTKSAIRAMDAIQAFAKNEFKQEITGFVVSGASKRGWTTWLTAAADPKRVKGIVELDACCVPEVHFQPACAGRHVAPPSAARSRGKSARERQVELSGLWE